MEVFMLKLKHFGLLMIALTALSSSVQAQDNKFFGYKVTTFDLRVQNTLTFDVETTLVGDCIHAAYGIHDVTDWEAGVREITVTPTASAECLPRFKQSFEALHFGFHEIANVRVYLHESTTLKNVRLN